MIFSEREYINGFDLLFLFRSEELEHKSQVLDTIYSQVLSYFLIKYEINAISFIFY